MAIPNTVAFRINERLIHGQGQLWARALGVNTITVTDDSASENIMQQALMKAMVPKTITMHFSPIQHACDVIMKTSPRQTIFTVCKALEDALKLAAGSVSVEGINVGNIRHIPREEGMDKYIALSGKDKATLRQLRDTYGIALNTRTTASGNNGTVRVGLNKRL